MDTQTNPNDTETSVFWNQSLSTGIETIDNQHKQLISMTDQLFLACTRGGEKREVVFKETMSHMVEYVRSHFSVELALFHRVKYPNVAEHIGEHDTLIKKILEISANYDSKKNNVPKEMVEFLREWIVSHIGHTDRMYAIFIADQKKKGLLSDKDIFG